MKSPSIKSTVIVCEKEIKKVSKFYTKFENNHEKCAQNQQKWSRIKNILRRRPSNSVEVKIFISNDKYQVFQTYSNMIQVQPILSQEAGSTLF
jgi:hypothetical protein